MDEAAENKDELNALAEKLDADFLIFNYEILPPADFRFMGLVAARKRKRKNVFLILTTEGGSADSAFRMMRFLQAQYDHITVIVAGWCKSAGTLMCIGAHALIVSDLGELGPLDVQIVKADEMGCVLQLLGIDAVLPRNSRNDQTPRLEFLNDGQSQPQKAGKDRDTVAGAIGAGDQKRPSRRNGASNLPGDSQERGSKKSSATPDIPSGTN